jgi:hypothetical protein
MAAHALNTPDGSRRRRGRAGAALGPRTRARLEAAAERLIGALDALDGDPDAEPDHEGEAAPDEASAQPLTLTRDLAPTTVLRRAPRFFKAVPALALVAAQPQPDAELIWLCDGHSDRLAAANDQAADDAEADAALRAYERSRDAISAATPATLHGAIAKARAALAEVHRPEGFSDLDGSMGSIWGLDVLRVLVRLGGDE